MIHRFLTLRLRWYARITAQLLLRRWQAIVLIVGLLSPWFVLESSNLVLVLLDQHHGMPWRFGFLGLWQVCSVLWALMQLDGLRGGRFRDFALSLPLSPRYWRTIDLLVLLVSDTPLFLPLASAAYALALAIKPSVDGLTASLLMTFMMHALLACQLEVLGGRARNLINMVLVNLWVAIALGLEGPARNAMLSMAVVAVLWMLFGSMPVFPKWFGALCKPVQGIKLSLTLLSLSKLPPKLCLSIGIVYRQHRSLVLGKLLFCLLVFVAFETVMSIWRFDAKSLPTALIAAALVALSSSGLFRYLKMSHQSAFAFTAALPMSRRWALPGDTVVVLSFGCPFVLAMACSLWYRAGLSVLQTAGFVASFAVLALLLRMPQLLSNRNAVVVSSVIAALWTYGVAKIL